MNQASLYLACKKTKHKVTNSSSQTCNKIIQCTAGHCMHETTRTCTINQDPAATSYHPQNRSSPASHRSSQTTPQIINSDNVFIYRNRTNAEAEAANYRVRVKRHLAAVHRVDSRGTKYGASNPGNEQLDINLSRSLLDIAHDANVFVPPFVSTSDSRASVSVDPSLRTVAVPPATDRSRQQGKRD